VTRAQATPKYSIPSLRKHWRLSSLPYVVNLHSLFFADVSQTENTIDEYLTGIRTDVPFTANEYRSVYETHLKSLRQFREHTIKYELLDKILTRLHNIGR
jgi:hypothetical protein